MGSETNDAAVRSAREREVVTELSELDRKSSLIRVSRDVAKMISAGLYTCEELNEVERRVKRLLLVQR